jgi:hypothetical protein
MAIDERRRQKKLARKAAKRKTNLAKKVHFGPVRTLVPPEKQVAFVASMPLHECLVPRGLFDQGIGNVVVSRKMPNDNVGFAIFLVDVFCLGIKNCFFSVLPQDKFDRKVRGPWEQEILEPMRPACVVKLIENAVAYAGNLGFHPHEDYAFIKRIFGDIDPAACPQEFVFGKDGKPFYISGPNETIGDSKRIVGILDKKLGPGAFDYLVQVYRQEE